VFDGDAVIDLSQPFDWDAHRIQGIRGLRVSAHFFIRRDGTLISRACTLRAWPADVGLARTERCNDFSIGINSKHGRQPFTEAQYAACTAGALAETGYPSRPWWAQRHARGRKTDPAPI